MTPFFYLWWLLVNTAVCWSALHFLQGILGKTGRLSLWLLLHASITLLVLRYQIPKPFFLALLAAVLFGRLVLGRPWRFLAAPLAVLFTLLTLLEGVSALVMAWAARTLPSPFWGTVFQCLLSLLTTAVLFLALEVIQRHCFLQEQPLLTFCLPPCLFLIFGVRAGLRLDSPAFAAYLCALDPETGPLLVLLLLGGGFLLFFQLQTLCGFAVRQALFQDLLRGQSRQLEEAQRGAAFRHDLRSHLLVLSGLLQDRDYQQARDYAQTLHRRSVSLSSLPATGRGALDALLAEKLSQAREADVEAICAIAIPQTLPFDDLDLCALFGNLLDNALHACQDLPPEQRRFTLRTSIRGKLLVVESANPTPPGHTVTPGTGLESLRHIAQAYRGSVQFTQGAEGFRIRILLCAA